MPNRIPLKAPWWSSLRTSELKIALEKEKGGAGDTGYGVYRSEDRIGYVYSTKSDSSTYWAAVNQTGEEIGREFPGRFEAVRFLAGHNA
jgi:hypothetical protein